MAHDLELAPERLHEEPLILIVPGIDNSNADHWQSRWEAKREDCRRVDLGRWDNPHRNTWVNKLSFDTFLRKFGLDDPALQQLAVIVRGADTSRHNLAPQSPGLYAISLSLSASRMIMRCWSTRWWSTMASTSGADLASVSSTSARRRPNSSACMRPKRTHYRIRRLLLDHRTLRQARAYRTVHS